MTDGVLQEIAVVGAFRSGTNLMKWLIECSYHARCSFNQWSWKHGLPPTTLSAAGHGRPSVPLVIMVKEPVRQNVSLFRHWQRTRPHLLAGRSFSQFVRAELIVHDNSYGGRGPKYLFATPTDYWNAFYFSYLYWDDVVVTSLVVRLDELEGHTANVVSQIGVQLGLVRRTDFDPQLPMHKVRPSPDGRAAQLDAAERHSDALEVSEEDRRFILSRVSPAVFQRIFGREARALASGS
jgi:hypothetical protein